MLVKLFNGVCIDPNSVKYLNVRGEMVREDGQMKQVYHVALKTDGDEMLKIGTYDDRLEAESLSEQCADKINKALGEGEEDADDGFGDDDFGGGDDDEDPFASGDDDEDPFASADDDDDPFAGGDDDDPFADTDDEHDEEDEHKDD